MAPKVLPTAISLFVQRCQQPRSLHSWLTRCLRKQRSDVPHASKQLHQPSIAKGESDHQTRRSQASRPHVDQAQHKGRQSESAQTEWCRVGYVTVLDLLVETRLELSSEGGQTVAAAAGVDVGEGPVAEAGGGPGGLVLLVGHLASHAGAGAVGLFVVGLGAVAGELGVGVGGHCEGEEVGEGGVCFEVEVG